MLKCLRGKKQSQGFGQFFFKSMTFFSGGIPYHPKSTWSLQSEILGVGPGYETETELST